MAATQIHVGSQSAILEFVASPANWSKFLP